MPKKKATTKKLTVTAPIEEKSKKSDRYVEAVGRRKTATARVRLTGGRGEFSVNGKKLDDYFRLPRLLLYASSPFSKLKISDKYNADVRVRGGGIRAQADAVRLGVARALAVKNPDFKRRLRKLGYLTRDPRMVERKKYGLKKARRAPQWAKR